MVKKKHSKHRRSQTKHEEIKSVILARSLGAIQGEPYAMSEMPKLLREVADQLEAILAQ